MSGYGWTEADLARHMGNYRGMRQSAEVVRQAKPSKYRNKKTTVDGITFDSAKEARRWQDLRALQLVGEIRGLCRQVSFPLRVNGELVTSWRADFVYDERVDGQWVPVAEDCKGYRTPEYKLKCKLVHAVCGWTIRET